MIQLTAIILNIVGILTILFAFFKLKEEVRDNSESNAESLRYTLELKEVMKDAETTIKYLHEFSDKLKKEIDEKHEELQQLYNLIDLMSEKKQNIVYYGNKTVSGKGNSESIIYNKKTKSHLKDSEHQENDDAQDAKKSRLPKTIFRETENGENDEYIKELSEEGLIFIENKTAQAIIGEEKVFSGTVAHIPEKNIIYTPVWDSDLTDAGSSQTLDLDDDSYFQLDEILRRYHEGESIREIARGMNIGIGEVQLAVEFSRKVVSNE